MAGIADVVPQPIFGPSLSIGGHTAQWNGLRGQGVTAGQVGVACRVVFEANVGDRVTSHLNICNDGTTAIYFSWKVLWGFQLLLLMSLALLDWTVKFSLFENSEMFEIKVC